MKITTAFLAVTDQDRAKAFYTEVLGFTVGTDFAAGDFRWLSLRADDQDGDVELVLGRATGPALEALNAQREAGMPAFTFTLTRPDEFEEIRARGAVVIREPQKEAYGGTDGLIEDGCGNIICLHRD